MIKDDIVDNDDICRSAYSISIRLQEKVYQCVPGPRAFLNDLKRPKRRFGIDLYLLYSKCFPRFTSVLSTGRMLTHIQCEGLSSEYAASRQGPLNF